ncbi:TonB-dependent receptor [Acidovorax sp. sic0104]|uniref:TonB-dependent siderophore receptor n=1 Tax=Acidovorax sp. sic0104 TaxID=2854784 RepID=UPI001C480FBC|nr:TonB-dependent receptor [Acidovorax sp. sic0104]MBV7541610.1 TonB-dependent receptor [Acidovorax sp. sic0104]
MSRRHRFHRHAQRARQPAAHGLSHATLRPVVLAMHLATASAVLAACAWTPGAHAQTQASEPARRFQIAAGNLTSVLNRFAEEAGVFLAAPAELTQGKRSPGLSGSFTVEQGFLELVRGQGLQVLRQANGSYALRPVPGGASGPAGTAPGEATLSSVTVKAALEADITRNLGTAVRAGALGDVAQKDTPFSSAVVSSQQIQEQAPQKLGDLFVQDASVSDNSGAYTAWSTYLTVRGMELDWQNSYRIDGKPFLGYTVTLPYDHMEQVELLKGATGFLYGFGAPGGMLNYVTKKPGDAPTRSASLGYAGGSIVRANADLGGRLGADGGLGYRLDVTREAGRTANDGSLERTSLLLALDAKLTDRLSWDLQTIFQDRLTEDTEPGIQTRALATRLPAPIRNDRTLVGPGNYVDNQFGFVATGFKYRLSDTWKAQTSFSQSYSKTRRNESILGLQNLAGDYIDARADYGERYQYSYWDAMLQGRVEAAGMTHHIVAGVSWQKQRNDDSRNAVYIPDVGTGNLARQNSVRYDSIGGFDSLGLYRLTEITQQSLFASDRITLDDRWSVLGGLRWIRYEKLNWNAGGAATDAYRENGIVTPTVAAMFKLSGDTMAYASYVQSLQQGATVSKLPTYTNAGEMLNPLMSRQWELGIKRDGTDWSATAALFRVRKTTEYDRSCGTDCLTKVQDGASVFQGLELGATARLDKGWSLGGNLMVLDSEYASGEEAMVGRRVAGAPRWVATAQVAYRVPQVPGLQVQVGAKYTGKTPLRADNSIPVDGYALASLGASYETRVGGRDTVWRASVHNLFNRKYWMYQYSNYIKAGDARSLNLSATVHF